jgi:cation:H+ antiporter
MKDFGVSALLLIFAGAAIATWIAGVWLAKATDVLDDRLNLGETIGGMVLLSITGSLPELAITITAARSGHLDIAAGNLIGGVAVQTLVLVIADRVMRGHLPLTTASASLVPALEGVLVIAVVAITVMGGLLPGSAAVGPIGVGSIAILLAWAIGMVALGRCRDRKDMGLALPAAASVAIPVAGAAGNDGLKGASTARNVAVFVATSVVTLVAGVLLEQSGDALATRLGINGVLFGATVLALASALPEISTAITGVRMQEYTLVFGDIFGGNAFQLILFVLADLLAGQPVLTHEGRANAWIGMIGLVMTSIYVAGILLRKPRRYWGLGPDSWAALIVYVFGIWGFVLVSR